MSGLDDLILGIGRDGGVVYQLDWNEAAGRTDRLIWRTAKGVIAQFVRGVSVGTDNPELTVFPAWCVEGRGWALGTIRKPGRFAWRCDGWRLVSAFVGCLRGDAEQRIEDLLDYLQLLEPTWGVGYVNTAAAKLVRALRGEPPPHAATRNPFLSDLGVAPV